MSKSDTAPPSSNEPSSERGFTSYRALPQRVGWAYLAATTFGRLPMAMVPLAILTLATSATGSIAIGGFAASAAAIGEAIGAPTSGYLADRWGQRGVLLGGVVLHVTFLVALVLTAGVGPDAITVALSGAAGLTLPQVGALSRARWMAVADGDLPAAFAFEGVVDELAYIFGPAIVGILAVTLAPQAAVIVAGILVVVFVTQFAVHRTHRLVPRRRDMRDDTETDDTAGAPAGRRFLVAVSLTGMLAMGVFFGASQTGLTAFAEEIGIPDAGALLYAVMAVGSAVTTIAMVWLPARIGLWTRWWIAGVGMSVGATLLLWAPGLGFVLAAAIFAGLFQGPLLLTIFTVTGSVVVNGRAGIAMTLAASGVVIGIAAGAAIAGVWAEQTGSRGAFALVLTASISLAVIGLAMAISSRLRERPAR
ncbi:MFS family permease [Microbacterium endophyticum]|uniref:MFS family permease n=1 Tax=Microbacterium endophyticum TaxID=1526412 RepID=A0A7W4V1J3_9MICO|nr:MFS transporter [Microbacterium endophyticum]MBB2975044.1 MFS family permease [Microbacterium endophyticum]NIK37416.1 MFS family permease [Microbacterium endophyticum]